jgi:polar amino acid transport system permease protein
MKKTQTRFSLDEVKAIQQKKERVWSLSVVAILLVGAWLSRGFHWERALPSASFLLKGLVTSWVLALSSIGIGMVAGVFLGVARLYGPVGIRHIAVGFIEIIRGIPQLMVIFWVFFTYPELTGRNIAAWPAAIISLSLIAAAYLAEVVRAGLTSIPRVQKESAYVTGLNPRQTFVFVVLPQALRNMVPALIAQFIGIFKTTSLVYVIGIIDFFRAVVLVNNREFAPYALYTTMAVVYFICCYILSVIVKKLDPKYDLTTV